MIGFHQIFGWQEKIINDFESFWSKIPINWLNFIHFYNIKISENINEYNSPIRLIQSIIDIQDFVSLKLDLKNNKLETSIALMLLNNSNIQQLIDELFLSIQFRYFFILLLLLLQCLICCDI